MFPNPNTGIMTLASEAGYTNDALVQIYTITGKLIMEFEWNGEAVPVDLTTAGKGLFFLKASGSKGIEYKQIVIQ
ncbi:MAG TPA: T9SS type A sorting domain-containing protein [Bacteroidales bacterium]|nr:T9SS type A sorting domain-containing protein [Bacteroidales bacterium]